MASLDIHQLRTGQIHDGEQLYQATGLLVAVIEGGPTTRPAEIAHSTLARLAENVANERLRALLDWWLVARYAERPHGDAYSIESVLSDLPVAQMVEIRDHARASGHACLPGIRLRRELHDKLLTFGSELHHEQGKASSLDRAWSEIESHYRQVFDDLQRGGAVESPHLTMPDVRSIMRNHDVHRSSDYWRRIERDWTRLDDVSQAACELALRGAANYLGPIPEPLAVPAVDPEDIASVVERLMLRDLLAPSPDPGDVFSLTFSDVSIAEPDDREWLAALTLDYCEERRVSPLEVASDHARIRVARRDIARLERSNLDLTMARLHLDDGQISFAEEAIELARALRAREDRTRNLRVELERLQQLAEEEATGEDLLNELSLAEADIDDGALDDAADKIRQLNDALSWQILQSRADRASGLLEQLSRMGGSVDDAVVARIEANEPTEEDLRRLEDIVDQTESALRSRVEDRIRIVEMRLDNEQQLLDAGVAEQVRSGAEGARRRVSLSDLPGADEAARNALKLLEESAPAVWSIEEGEDRLVTHLRKYVTDRLGFASHDIDRLYVGLKTKRFAILSGLTGSGKTTIARLFAESIGASASNGRFVRIAVRPNWVDEAEVLGYVNPMTQRFEPGWLTSLIRTCERMPDLPVFCLLDEMNLAPVEYYLADYLSALEEAAAGADTSISLYPAGATPSNGDEWPAAIAFPSNLFLIGTVNVDESTRPLSDRVLDRANVLQLSVVVNDRHHDPVEGDQLEPRWQVRMRDWRAVCAVDPSREFHEFLVEVGEVLNTTMRLGLGVRAHIEIERFIANSHGVIDAHDALDLAMLQRLIPKIRGFRRDLSKGIEELRDLCEERQAVRCSAVLDAWLAEHVSDDDFIDGTHGIVGLVSSR